MVRSCNHVQLFSGSTHMRDRYFTLAHEIAHNLVQPHNAEHEFYFSSICEAHMDGLISVLQSTHHVAS